MRKISGITKPSKITEERFEEAVADITLIATALLADLPPRKNPPPTEPPLRRLARASAS